MGVGEKSCEQDSGTVFSAENLNDTMAIKEQLNISELWSLCLTSCLMNRKKNIGSANLIN